MSKILQKKIREIYLSKSLCMVQSFHQTHDHQGLFGAIFYAPQLECQDRHSRWLLSLCSPFDELILSSSCGYLQHNKGNQLNIFLKRCQRR